MSLAKQPGLFADASVSALRGEDASEAAEVIRAAFGAQSKPTRPPSSALGETAETIAAKIKAGGGFGMWVSAAGRPTVGATIGAEPPSPAFAREGGRRPGRVWPAATQGGPLARATAETRDPSALVSKSHPSPLATPSPLRGQRGPAAGGVVEDAFEPPWREQDIASLKGRLVAIALWHVGGDRLYIGRVATLPAWRGREFARGLIAACEGEARARALNQLTLRVRLELLENENLFIGLGFRRIALAAHEGFAEPTIAVMEKRLA